MARKIEGLIFKIQYDVSWSGNYVECKDITDLFDYLAEQQLKGWVFLNVTQICNDGSTPRVAVRTNSEFKRIQRKNNSKRRRKKNYNL